MLVGVVASFKVKVMAEVEPSSFLVVMVVPVMLISAIFDQIINRNCAKVGVDPSAA